MIKKLHIMNTLLIIMMVMVSLLTAGCAGGENVSASKEKIIKQAEQKTNSDKKTLEGAHEAAAVKAETARIIVYHATSDALYLMPEVHAVPKPEHYAQAALELLISGTTNKELSAVMPQGTKLRGVIVKNHIAYADFSDAIVKNGGGSATEILLVGAIVNTLTEIPDIQKVQILIEGKKADTISGHVDISQPLSRNERLIKKGV